MITWQGSDREWCDRWLARWCLLLSLFGTMTLGACDKTTKRRQPVVVPPAVKTDESDSGGRPMPNLMFDQFFYQRPSGTNQRHRYLVSQAIRLGAIDKGTRWGAFEVFLESNRRFVLRYSEFDQLDASSARPQTWSFDGGAHDIVQGAWSIERGVLLLGDLAVASKRIQDGKEGLRMDLSRDIKSNGLAGQWTFLTLQERSQGLD